MLGQARLNFFYPNLTHLLFKPKKKVQIYYSDQNFKAQTLTFFRSEKIGQV